jgi:predicted GIY-YIG superfamily endonuclease
MYEVKKKVRNKEYDRMYYLANKERIAKYYKEYNASERGNLTKEDKRNYASDYRAKSKHEPLVYLIVKENYVGTTENLHLRLSVHDKKYNRDISEVIILGSFNERSTALELECSFHEMGYKGRHKLNTYK